jgi:hypothetical protein
MAPGQVRPLRRAAIVAGFAVAVAAMCLYLSIQFTTRLQARKDVILLQVR